MKKYIKYASLSILSFIILVLIARFIVLFNNGFSVSKILSNLVTPLTTAFFWKCFGGLLIILILYGFRILIVKYYFDKYGKIKASVYSILVIGGIVLIYFVGQNKYENNDQLTEYHYKVPNLSSAINPKKNIDSVLTGANVFGWEAVSEKSFNGLENLNINWVTIMPFDYQESTNSTKINFLDALPNLRKKDSTFINLIKLCHRKNIKVMLKPHLWIESGWRTNLNLKNDKDWNLWFSNFSKLALQYAKVAEESNTEIYCFGTELLESVERQPNKWKQLIKDIKTIYKGKLTYAANWNVEYKEIPFWEDLDYIGIQAYYPMKTEGKATVKKLRNSIRPYLDILARFSSVKNKKIIYTEVGYRSIEQNTNKPWEWPNELDIFSKIYSEDSQAQAYNALFSESFGKEWFAGAFIWEYDFNEDNGPLPLHRYNFSPRHKTGTEDVIRDFYSKSN